jgi:hypothetical protein
LSKIPPPPSRNFTVPGPHMAKEEGVTRPWLGLGGSAWLQKAGAGSMKGGPGVKGGRPDLPGKNPSRLLGARGGRKAGEQELTDGASRGPPPTTTNGGLEGGAICRPLTG